KTIEEQNLLPGVHAKGELLRARLANVFRDHPHVGDIRGRGLFLGVELVADVASKRPFDPARKMHAVVKREAMARGLLVYPSGGTIDGTRGDHILIAPPFIVQPPEIDSIALLLRQAVDAATNVC